MLRFALILLFSLTTGSTLANPERWRAEGWKTDFSQMAVGPKEILSGGPPKDGIPPIDEPKFIAVSEVSDLTDRDPVISLEVNGDARAYPLRVMTWHEIVNDVVGGTPVAVTYCPLCNAAIVFDARIDGKAVTFGTTGKLRKSDLVMYDRPTESWWQQFSGEAIMGAHTGKRLKVLPARLVGWSAFKANHPDGKVLVPNNARLRDYGRNPYVNYDIGKRPFLFAGKLPEGIDAMARVVVIRRASEEPLVVAMDKLRRDGAVTIDGHELTWEAGQASALHTSRISEGRDVGSVSVKRNGNAVAHDVTFAFVAHAFHPQTTILQ